MIKGILQVLYSLRQCVESFLTDTTSACRLWNLQVGEGIVKKLELLLQSGDSSLKISEIFALESFKLGSETINFVTDLFHSTINLLRHLFLQIACLLVSVLLELHAKLVQINSGLLLERCEIVSHLAHFDLNQFELLQDGCSVKVTNGSTWTEVHRLECFDAALMISKCLIIDIQSTVTLISASLKRLNAAEQVIYLIVVSEGIEHLFLKSINAVDCIVRWALAGEEITELVLSLIHI